MDSGGGHSMSTNIDELLTRLGHIAPDRALDQLEPLVWTRIAPMRLKPSGPTTWGWRGAVAAAALAVGVAMGGAAAARAPGELALFSAHTQFAPSTLLGLSG